MDFLYDIITLEPDSYVYTFWCLFEKLDGIKKTMAISGFDIV